MRKARREQAEWRRLVEAWRSSGLSAGAFAASQGDAITARTLTAWGRRLRHRARGTSSEPLEFIEMPTPVARPSPERLVIRLPSGVRVYLSGDLAFDRVVALVRTLEGR